MVDGRTTACTGVEVVIKRNFMHYKNRLSLTLIASALTAVVIIWFRDLSFPSISPDGTISNFTIGLAALLATNFLAAVPGYCLLKLRSFPNGLGVSVIAVLESFWLGYALTPIAFSLAGSIAWDITT